MGHQAISTSAPDFRGAGLRELKRAAPELEVQEPLAPGVTMLRVPGTFSESAARVRARPPIFVRHLCPADLPIDLVTVSDPRTVPDLLAERAAALAPRVDPKLRFSVQTRLLSEKWPFGPFEVNRTLSEALQAATGAILDVREPEQVLSVTLTADTAFLGLSRVEENLSPWAGGARRFARTPEQVSRSEFKLLEALEVFGDWLPGKAREGEGARGRGGEKTGSVLSPPRPFAPSPPRSAAPQALDLGAAPGGWTRLLRERGYRVVAVDPADLDPRVAADRGVRHVPLTAQEFLRQNRERYELIVNDMRLDARDSARIMRQAVRALSPEGHALMTLKLPTRDPEQVMHQALAHLLGPYHLLAARQLFHNRSEVTLLMAPKGERPAGD